MTSKRDVVLHRYYYLLKIKQAVFFLFCSAGIYYSYAKQNFSVEVQQGVIAFLALVAFITLINFKGYRLFNKHWLLFVLCMTSIYFYIEEDIPRELLHIHTAVLSVLGCLYLIRMELLYAKEHYNLTLFPPGFGSLGNRKTGNFGRFLSMWELITKFKWKRGGIFFGRPLPEHQLFGLFNFKVGSKIDNRHCITIAANQSGKGTAAIIPNLLEYPGSAIVIDPKGELAKITAARRGKGSNRVTKYLGQNVFVFDPEGIVNGFSGAHWNPLDELDVNDPLLWAHVEKIATTIIPQQKDSGDGNTEFFRNQARTLLIAIIIHTLETESEEHHNLIYIRQLIMEGDLENFLICLENEVEFPNARIALFELIAYSKSQNGKVARAAKSFLSTAEETQSGTIGTLEEQTNFLDNPALERFLQTSDFSLKDLKRQPTTIYLCLKASSLATPMVKILSLVIDLAIIAAENINEKPDHSILFIMDEFYALGRNETIDKAMGLMAGYGITLWPILQHIGQLQKLYPDTWDNFLRNCRGLQFFGEQSPETLKWIEERIGYKMHKYPDGSTERIPLMSAQELASGFFYRESRRQVYIPTGYPVALLELMDYYRFYSKRCYNDLDDEDILNS